MRQETPAPFSHLAAGGRFHQDNALGRLFHPGTASYRQISAVDSVHLAVTPDFRISAHVDRVSPLRVRAGRRCRYSICRALAHNAVAAWELTMRLARGQHGHQACHLACEIVWVPDDGDPADEPAVDVEPAVA